MSGTLALTEEQELLARAAAELVDTHAPLAATRGRRAAGDRAGYDVSLWARLADLGWVGITLPEAHGGSGGRLADLAVILEALGRTLTPTPLLSTELLAGRLLAEAETPDQQVALLSRVCAGRAVLALALEDHGHHDRTSPSTTARSDGAGGYVLEGAKQMVLDGHVAERLIVIARLVPSGELSGFLVDPADPGVTVHRRHLLDERIVAFVRLDRVAVTGADVVGEPGALGPLLDEVCDRATAGLCAEMLGAATAAFDHTVQYLRDRVQFGVPIGSFQALQHRAAAWLCDLELARSIVMDAIAAVDERRSDAGTVVSAAKATMSDLFLRSGAEAIQLHGGIGMTDEADVGLFVKRARVDSVLLGDATFHRRRFAALQGY